MVDGSERLRPPSLPDRNIRVQLADLARPDQHFRNLNARESRFFSPREIGNSSTIRNQLRHGHTPDLHIKSFCLFVKGQASILTNMLVNLERSSVRDFDLSGEASMCKPRNLTPFGAKGIADY